MQDETKASLRREFLKDRAAMSAADIARLSARMCHHLETWLKMMAPSQLFLFSPYRGEPDLLNLRTQIRLCLPKIEDPAKMSFRLWTPGEALEPNRFGILEPPSHASEQFCDAKTAIIVPCVAVDQGGARLGFGGGFYDRYLAAHTPAWIIAVTYARFVVAQLPKEPWDIGVGLILTEEGLSQAKSPQT